MCGAWIYPVPSKAQAIGGLLARVKDGSVQNYTYDGNGNVSEVLNSDGSIAAHYEYDPYGNTIKADGASAQENQFRFSTKYLDAETGLYYYGYRYYSPALGRWLSKDPISELGGTNLYAFTINDPVDIVDPDGRAIWPFGKQPQYEIIPQGINPTYPTSGIWMCKQRLIGKKTFWLIHHRFIVFDGVARGFEKHSKYLWGGPGRVRFEAEEPLSYDVQCYEMKCLKKDCAKKIFDRAITNGADKTYQLGYRDCQSWANNVENSMYHECEDCNCPEEDKPRRWHWKTTGWSKIRLVEDSVPEPTQPVEPIMDGRKPDPWDAEWGTLGDS